MLNFFKHKNIVKSNKVLGVHCFVQQDGSMLFNYVLIARSKGKIEIDSYKFLEGGLDQLAGEVSMAVPVYVSIDGKGVLTKKVTIDPIKLPIHQVIPNATEDDFLVQQSKGSNNHVFVSIARKDVIDELLANFTQHKFQVIGLTIGPFKAVELIPVFEQLPAELTVGNNLISFDKKNGEIIDFKKCEDSAPRKEYILDEKTLSADDLLPLYNALTYYLADDEGLKYAAVLEQYDEYASKRLFAFAGWGALLFIFLVLVINMLFFTSFSEEKQKLETRVVGDKELLGNLKKLNEELAWKENFLGQAGILNNNRMSYYADRIAASIPDAITLEKMDVHPVASKVKKEKEIQVVPDKITMDGFAGKSEALNDWIKDMKSFSWIEDVSVVNYFKEENSATGMFTIEIKFIKDKGI
jgi:hypothetical protein